MAKFTKLNIGEAVASSGGRVWKKLSAESAEVQDELSGTWLLNPTVKGSGSSGHYYYLNGSFKGKSGSSLQEYPLLKVWIGKSTELFGIFILFNGEDGNYSSTRFYNSASKVEFRNQAGDISSAVATTADGIQGRTFTITSTVNDIENGSELLEWLKANATKTA